MPFPPSTGRGVISFASVVRSSVVQLILAGGWVTAAPAAPSDVPVNTFATAHESAPAVAAQADGSFVVVWESANQDGSGYGVFGRRLAADGNAIGAEFLVS